MERIEILKTFFKGRKDAFVLMKRTRKGVLKKTVYAPLDDALLEKHLAGEHRISVFLIDEEGKVYWGGFDIDGFDEDHKKAGIALYEKCWDLGIGAHIYLTGGRGFRVVCLFSGVESTKVYSFLRHVYESVRSSIPDHVKIEIFPKQPKLTEEVRLGSALSLPFGLHPETQKPSYFVTSEFEEINDIEDYFDGVIPSTEEDLDAIKLPPFPIVPKCEGMKFAQRGAPCLEEIVKKGIPLHHRNVCLFIFACHLKVLGLPDLLIRELVHYMNAAKCEAPLPHREVEGIIKQALKKRYRKRGCDDPLWAELYCGDAQRKKCAFFQMRNFPIRIVEWQKSRPSRFRVEVSLPDGAKTLRKWLTVRTLLNKTEMEKLIVDEFGYCWQDLGMELKGEEYKQAVTERIREATQVEMGEEASEEGRLKEILIDHLKDLLLSGHEANSAEQFRAGFLFIENDRVYFNLPPLHRFMKKHGNITRPDLVALLREIGAEHVLIYVEGVRFKAWMIEKDRLLKMEP